MEMEMEMEMVMETEMAPAENQELATKAATDQL